MKTLWWPTPQPFGGPCACSRLAAPGAAPHLTCRRVSTQVSTHTAASARHSLPPSGLLGFLRSPDPRPEGFPSQLSPRSTFSSSVLAQCHLWQGFPDPTEAAPCPAGSSAPCHQPPPAIYLMAPPTACPVSFQDVSPGAGALLGLLTGRPSTGPGTQQTARNWGPVLAPVGTAGQAWAGRTSEGTLQALPAQDW